MWWNLGWWSWSRNRPCAVSSGAIEPDPKQPNVTYYEHWESFVPALENIIGRRLTESTNYRGDVLRIGIIGGPLWSATNHSVRLYGLLKPEDTLRLFRSPKGWCVEAVYTIGAVKHRDEEEVLWLINHYLKVMRQKGLG